MAFARTVATTHTKTLISPSTGSADLVYGADYVSATSHTSTPTVSGATSGGIPYFDSTTSEASSALQAAASPILGGGAGTAPYTDAGLTSSGTGATFLLNPSLLDVDDGSASAVAIRFASRAGYGIFNTSGTTCIAFNGIVNFGLNDSTLTVRGGGVIGWANVTPGVNAPDAGFSRTGAATVALGNGSSGNASGTFNCAAYQVGGAAGASFGPGLPTSLTFVNGICTAAS